MKAWTVIGFAALALGLAMTVQCGKQATVPVAASEVAPPGYGEQLPFDRQGQGEGISPSSAVIPPGARIPAGTLIDISLQSELTSRTAHSGDTFQAKLDQPIVVNGRIFAEAGEIVTGRVMEARAGELTSPGYLRLALNSISINGKSSVVHTSSHFTKGGSAKMGKGLVSVNQGDSLRPVRDVTIGPDRHLTFRLTAPIRLRD
jgi:hypothetical protein